MAVNGRIPTSELVFVGNDVDGQPAYLHKGAAADWFAMKAACLKETGVTLTISGGGGAYRTYALQEYYYDQYRNHGGANAADPGTSNHGWGKAVDIYNWSRAYSWLLANCHRWGFENNYAPEGWHYQHLSDTAIAGLEETPLDNEQEEEVADMRDWTIIGYGRGENETGTEWHIVGGGVDTAIANSQGGKDLAEKFGRANTAAQRILRFLDPKDKESKLGEWEELAINAHLAKIAQTYGK